MISSDNTLFLDAELARKCSKCGRTLPLSAFYKQGGRPRSPCRECRIILSNAWNKANPDKARAAKRAWKKENPVRVNAKKRDRRAADPDKYRAKERDRRAADPDKYRAKERNWRNNNPEKTRYYRLITYWDDPNKARARSKAWAKANPEKRRIYQAARRARKNGAPGNGITAVQWEHIISRKRRCYWCRKRFTKEDPAVQDHVIALKNGGAHDITNVVPAHRSCNCSKGTKRFTLL